MITPDQCRAGRALLDWTQPQLAEKANIGVSTLRDFEISKRVPVKNNLLAIRAALEAAGIVFLEDGQPAIGSGVSRRHPADEGIKPEQLTSANDG
ncbi:MULTISPECIES: helix-turn-helix transcriptional regulator [unclassified Chelatococcus]|uniref:helix-turn-helix domain-containing protein n=1 Tax=unclassified Chelatococcus TaxID=2638111 RepID=UPI001BCC5924|nr:MULTISPECIES: helix-turn-helix transcriptional regulator [unclassified Chelatococcus]CAH1672459.1 Transcriptional regulator with XRE-family HTH domain [Hyphomicrobiales bacterium]MBS7738947.1 transcriptional regulator [Chelatococcus sp. HY11]MBX3543380.1 transcriptional regulator [Chelatococcus sp.]MCO5076524.1 helix-turn-helix domain-containing protein [Chelatococcus sp.]CAH1675303.1 Transcriptional regulator with XRE-family HTH domain [Hyphomicrobiales bacterium]